jgi:hypothetical protein
MTTLNDKTTVPQPRGWKDNDGIKHRTNPNIKMRKEGRSIKILKSTKNGMPSSMPHNPQTQTFQEGNQEQPILIPILVLMLMGMSDQMLIRVQYPIQTKLR